MATLALPAAVTHAVTGAVTGVRRPLWPALATVLLLALPADRWTIAGGRVAVADVASLLLVGVCGALLTRGPRPRLTPRAALLLGAPAVAFAVATAASHDPAASLPGFARLLQTFVLVPLALVLLLRDRRDVRLLAAALVGLALVQGAVGTAQFLTGTGASYQGRYVRAVGTFGPLNVMSMATVVSLGLIAALALGLAPGRGAPAWRRPVALGCAAALSVPLVVSFSRGAWLATAMAALAVALPVLLRLPRRTLLGVVCGGVLLAVPAGAVALGSGLVGDRLGSMGEVAAAPDQSVVDRYAMWDAALSIWRAEPLTGTGPKGFAAYRDSHASLALSGGSDTDGAGAGFRRQELESPHNMYLLVLAEQGLVGAVALVGAWAALAVCCVARLRAAVRRGGPVDVGLLALGLLVWHAVDFVYADIGGPTTVLTAVAFGVTAWWALSPAAGRERLP